MTPPIKRNSRTPHQASNKVRTPAQPTRRSMLVLLALFASQIPALLDSGRQWMVRTVQSTLFPRHQCQAHTDKGRRCSRSAEPNASYCWQHRWEDCGE